MIKTAKFFVPVKTRPDNEQLQFELEMDGLTEREANAVYSLLAEDSGSSVSDVLGQLLRSEAVITRCQTHQAKMIGKFLADEKYRSALTDEEILVIIDRSEEMSFVISSASASTAIDQFLQTEEEIRFRLVEELLDKNSPGDHSGRRRGASLNEILAVPVKITTHYLKSAGHVALDKNPQPMGTLKDSEAKPSWSEILGKAKTESGRVNNAMRRNKGQATL